MGPLAGIRGLEVGGIGPGPFCGMMLSDMGAEIIRLERKDHVHPIELRYDTMLRGRRAIIGVDLKSPKGVEVVLRLVERSHLLYEGFRPGVMEGLGLGPDVCLARNPGVVYGRVTGWGQEGPLASAAGHDINYIAIMGVLHAIGGHGQKPVPPINLIGDFAGGGMLLAFGLLCGLLRARETGEGQVVDTAMVDGIGLLMATTFGLLAAGLWQDERGRNLLDGGAHFYDSYETADGKYVSVGALEPKFYSRLLKLLGVDGPEFHPKMNVKKWPALREKLAAIFRTKTREEWCRILDGQDCCFTPVLSLQESMDHPHNVTRKGFVDIDGVRQPAPAPRFSRTPPEGRGVPPTLPEHNESVLKEWGFSAEELHSLKQEEVI